MGELEKYKEGWGVQDLGLSPDELGRDFSTPGGEAVLSVTCSVLGIDVLATRVENCNMRTKNISSTALSACVERCQFADVVTA
jgi:hypothetical protein